MKTLFIASTIVLFAQPVLAFKPLEPVNTVMSVTAKNWSSESDYKYIFDEDLLSSLYSTSFITAYLDAAKKSVYADENDDAADPFGFDVVTNSQDGCPIEELNIVGDGSATKESNIVATFKVWACMTGNDMSEMKNEVHFKVIEENGRAVIDDIIQIMPDEKMSIRDMMMEISNE